MQTITVEMGKAHHRTHRRDLVACSQLGGWRCLARATKRPAKALRVRGLLIARAALAMVVSCAAARNSMPMHDPFLCRPGLLKRDTIDMSGAVVRSLN
jgi:hypothetical protein